MKTYLQFFIAFLFTINTVASPLQCSNLFQSPERGSIEFLANQIDQINESKGQGLIFSESLNQKLQSRDYNQPLFKKVISRYYRFKIKRILDKINDMDQNIDTAANIDRYELDIMVDKLLRLSFLNDPNVFKESSIADRNIIFNARKAILSQGLVNYLFKDSRQSFKKETKVKIIFELILKPFKDEYFRWSYAFLIAPKLKGSVLPSALAEKILIDGIDAHRAELQPYLTTVHGKFIFNKLSSFYNWVIVISLVSIVPVSMYYYNQARDAGIKKAVSQLTNVELSTRKAAETPAEVIKAEMHFANMVHNLERKYNRSLTSEELLKVRLYIEEKYNVELN